ncbi:glycosyltransferase [Arthrobacter sp. B1I2]|uniref:glycosyltransferase n=1 Tax=Arthrobacter sp. B1I2 TaxID=3042263 RepID=UPI002786C75C|nr:glycosyltransferase [Arthrobacter sp. B1I2]MDQ0731131.1 glycosyltransferase involved in cell wall biosynthesis [Arthrobacter sp. B1I2]
MGGLLVHEWIARSGGSENVLQAMSNTFPTSDIYCLWNDAHQRFANRVVKESLLAKTPLRKNKAAALPFMPMVWGTVALDSYEWTLVSSHLFAHHVGTRRSRANSKIFAYIHTPARYIWVPELDKRGQSRVSRRISPVFQSLDRKRASEGTTFAANSNFIKQRIRGTWEQDATVIYPPVAIANLQSQESWADLVTLGESEVLSSLPPEYILGASRFVAYKQLENVVAAGEAANLPVVLAGAGPEEAYLRNVAQDASVPVFFVKSPSDTLLFALIQKAQVFVFPPVEDFGILPVEAMALGTPVVVNAVGGAVESVSALNGGSAVSTFSGSEIAEALSSTIGKDMTEATSKAAMFSEESFSANLREWMSA